jgi:hypothetical protein
VRGFHPSDTRETNVAKYFGGYAAFALRVAVGFASNPSNRSAGYAVTVNVWLLSIDTRPSVPIVT